MVKQSKFGLAFNNARKQGLDKFLFNGNWYSTKTKEEKKVASHSGVNKIKLNQKTAKPVLDNSGRVVGGRNQNRLRIQKDKKTGAYALIDTETGQVFNSGNDAKSLLKWAVLNQDLLGEFTITSQRTKLDRNTPGYLPVDTSDLVDSLGNSRVYLNRDSGQYFVTDKFGNIIGDSFDPNAGKNGFKGWNIFTGSKRDMERASSGKLKARSDMNEVNLKSEQKHDRITDEHERLMQGLLRTLGMANLAQSTLNMPNNIVTGALRTMRDDYSWQDYADSFDIDNMWKGEKQSVGLGDLIGVENPYLKFAADLINPMALAGVAAGASKSVTLNKPLRIKSPNHEMGAYEYRTPGVSTVDPTRGQVRYVGNDMASLKGKYVGNIEGKGSMLPTSGAKSTEFSTLGRNSLVTTRGNGPARIQSPEIIQFKHPGVSSNTPQIKNLNFKTGKYTGHNGDLSVKEVSHVGTYPIEGTFSSYIPGAKTTHYHLGKPYFMDAAYNYTERPKTKYFDETPTATFDYDVAEPNKTVINRIQTGDFVPGSTSPNWDGTIGGGSVDIYNQKGYHSPIFGGTVAGPANNNKSNWYKALGYHKFGGKLK